MNEWTELERAALLSFISTSGALKSGLEKFTQFHSQTMKACCALHMATVPRNPEVASDYAAKAQLLDEFWALLTDMLMREQPVPEQVS